MLLQSAVLAGKTREPPRSCWLLHVSLDIVNCQTDVMPVTASGVEKEGLRQKLGAQTQQLVHRRDGQP